MKMLFVVFLTLVAVCAAQTYDIKNDNFDINEITADPKQLQKLVDCFLDRAPPAPPCSPIAADFKNYMPEAIQQACAKCTEAQKYIIKRFFEALEKTLPSEYEAYKLKYDPENKYLVAFRAAVESSSHA